MTQQKQPPPIRARGERASDPARSDGASSMPEGGGDSAADPVREIREQAQAMGYDVRRMPRGRRPRPEPEPGGGRISTNCRIHPGVRDVMDQAKLELNMNYSDMVNAGVIMFLKSQGLRIDVDEDQFIPGR